MRKWLILSMLMLSCAPLEAAELATGKQDVQNPVYSFPRAVYPPKSVVLKEEGVVHLAVTVQNGQVLKVEIETGSGSPRLDKAAVLAAQKMRVAAGERNRYYLYRIPVRFQLAQEK